MKTNGISSQETNICSSLAIEILEEGVKYA